MIKFIALCPFTKPWIGVSENLINSLVKEVKEGIGVLPIIPVTDSIRKVDGDTSTHVNRSNLFKVQTPQCFLSSDIKEAYSQKYSEELTDDASVFEAYRGKINSLIDTSNLTQGVYNLSIEYEFGTINNKLIIQR